MQIVYKPHCDNRLFWNRTAASVRFQEAQPGRSWGLLRREFGATSARPRVAVGGPVSDEEPRRRAQECAPHRHTVVGRAVLRTPSPETINVQ